MYCSFNDKYDNDYFCLFQILFRYLNKPYQIENLRSFNTMTQKKIVQSGSEKPRPTMQIYTRTILLITSWFILVILLINSYHFLSKNAYFFINTQ
jgi:hypothetical protein